MRWTMLVLGVLGCAEEPQPSCAAGFETGADGACHRLASDDDDAPVPPDPVDPEPPEGLLAELPPCTAAGGDGELDLATSCVGRACLVMTYDQLRAELGRPLDCFDFVASFGGYEQGYVYCDFAGGIEASFYDADLDGEPDPDGAPFDLTVALPYDGTTDEGYGVGSEWSCFLRHEEPFDMGFVADGAGWSLTSLSFDGYVVAEQASLYEDARPDGLVDRITFRAR